MTTADLRERWIARRDEFARLGAQVDGVKIIDEFLADVVAATESEQSELLRLRDAARESG